MKSLKVDEVKSLKCFLLCQKSLYPLLKHNYIVNFSMNWHIREQLAHMPCAEFNFIPNSYIEKENYRQ